MILQIYYFELETQEDSQGFELELIFSGFLFGPAKFAR